MVDLIIELIVENVGIFLTIITAFPATYIAKKIKKKNITAFWTVTVCLCAIYGILIFTNVFMVKFPESIDNVPFRDAVRELDKNHLKYTIAYSEDQEDIKSYSEYAFYVTAVNTKGNSYVLRGSTITLEVMNLSYEAQMFDELMRLINDISDMKVMVAEGNDTSAIAEEVTDDDSQSEDVDVHKDEDKQNSDSASQKDADIESPTSENTNSYEETISIEFTSINVSDSYYYEYPTNNPSVTSVVDFGPGINGTFRYSRDLTDFELDNWGHTGKLYDAEGKLISEPGNYPWFWSLPDGHFAVQFPVGFDHGTYTYELDNVIGDQWVTATIQFAY